MGERMTSKALVLFSGGQDSTTCLAWSLSRFDLVETIGFDYRQRHSVELECRQRVFSSFLVHFPNWAAKLGQDVVLDLGVLGQISDTALTSDRRVEMQANGLPNTFVPGRNLLFFTLAAAVAYRRGISTLVGGMCETDYSGYPDCRDETLRSLQNSLSLGTQHPFRIETPLMWIEKADTWALARELGGERLVQLIRDETHTCYLGKRDRAHEWGFGCGTCPACELRASGYKKFAAATADSTA
jgi:7-cyano-7-deazaguanine synthase